MDWSKILDVIFVILTLVAGAIATYYKTNRDLQQVAMEEIANAEEAYKDTVKQGKKKMLMCVIALRNTLPEPLRIIFTDERLEEIIQACFDSIRKYADITIAKVISE